MYNYVRELTHCCHILLSEKASACSPSSFSSRSFYQRSTEMGIITRKTPRPSLPLSLSPLLSLSVCISLSRARSLAGVFCSFFVFYISAIHNLCIRAFPSSFSCSLFRLFPHPLLSCLVAKSPFSFFFFFFFVLCFSSLLHQLWAAILLSCNRPDRWPKRTRRKRKAVAVVAIIHVRIYSDRFFFSIEHKKKKKEN